MKYIYILLFTIVFCTTHSYAIDRQTAEPDSASWEQVIDSSFSPTVYIAFGVTNRIDQTSILDHASTYHIKIYKELTNMISLKFGGGYNHSTEFEKKNGFPTALIRNYYLEAGVRWSFHKNKNSFYVENSLEYNTYKEPQYDQFEQRIGINVSIGFNIHFVSSYYIDFAIGHTINNIDFGEREFYPENSDDPNIRNVYSNHVIGILGTDFYEELYSPTFFRMMVMVKL